MTAIQIDDSVRDIMRLPCVKECHKEKNGRFSFVLWDGAVVREGDWIIDAESPDAAFVLSDENYQKVCSACCDSKIRKFKDNAEVCADLGLTQEEYSDIVNDALFGEKEDTEPDRLTEIEAKIRSSVTEALCFTSEDGNFSTAVYMDEQTTKKLSGILLPFIRKKIAGGIDIDAMTDEYINTSVVIDSMNDTDVYDAMVGMRKLIRSSYRAGIEDAIMEIEKG